MKFQGKTLTDEFISFNIIDDKFSEVKIIDDLEVNDKLCKLILPGFIDIQVNGYNGVDFNSNKFPSLQQLKDCFFHLAKAGTTSIFPTFITNDIGLISDKLSMFIGAMKEESLINSMVKGFHFEGPFISPSEGPRGAHNGKYIVEPNMYSLENWHQIAPNHIKILTISPHWNNTVEFIKAAKALGYRISIGHTNASRKQINAAIHAGASMSTHLGNGCLTLMHRHENVLWPQLADEKVATCFIADGFHLPIDLIKIICKLKRDKAILVSDVTEFGNMPSGDYQSFIGERVTLTPQKKLHKHNNPEILAGSSFNMLEAINYLLNENIIPLKDIVNLATNNPASFLEMNYIGKIEKNYKANFLITNKRKNNIEIEDVFIEGRHISNY